MQFVFSNRKCLNYIQLFSKGRIGENGRRSLGVAGWRLVFCSFVAIRTQCFSEAYHFPSLPGMNASSAVTAHLYAATKSESSKHTRKPTLKIHELGSGTCNIQRRRRMSLRSERTLSGPSVLVVCDRSPETILHSARTCKTVVSRPEFFEKQRAHLHFSRSLFNINMRSLNVKRGSMALTPTVSP